MVDLCHYRCHIPELRTTQSGVSVTSFTVAVDRDYTPQGGQKETDFIDCVAWRQGGEFVSKYFHKGSMIVVSGRLESRKWTDRNGQNRTSWEIQVDHSYFGEAKRQDGYSQMDGGYSDGYAGGEPQYTAPQKPRTMGYGAQGTPFQEQSYQQSMAYGPYGEVEDDGELPF